MHTPQKLQSMLDCSSGFEAIENREYREHILEFEISSQESSCVIQMIFAKDHSLCGIGHRKRKSSMK